MTVYSVTNDSHWIVKSCQAIQQFINLVQQMFQMKPTGVFTRILNWMTYVLPYTINTFKYYLI